MCMQSAAKAPWQSISSQIMLNVIAVGMQCGIRDLQEEGLPERERSAQQRMDFPQAEVRFSGHGSQGIATRASSLAGEPCENSLVERLRYCEFLQILVFVIFERSSGLPRRRGGPEPPRRCDSVRGDWEETVGPFWKVSGVSLQVARPLIWQRQSSPYPLLCTDHHCEVSRWVHATSAAPWRLTPRRTTWLAPCLRL